jgi:hypothetical protein
MAPEHYVIVATALTLMPWETAHEAAAWHLDEGPAWAIVLEGDVLAVGGLHLQGDGTAGAWVLVSPLGRRFPFTLHRLARVGLAVTAARFHLHHVEIEIPGRHVADRRMLARAGFRELGCLEAPASDTILLAKET